MTQCLDHELLERFAAQQCSASERQDVEAHLAECSSCRRRVESCKANERFLGGMQAVMDREGLDWPSSQPDHDGADSKHREILGKPAACVDSEAPSDLSATPTIEGYRILKELSRGGQGIVYKATQAATKRAVALKVLAGGRYTSVRQRDRFEREVDLAASLQHPNIVTIHDSGVHRGHYYLAMEYIQGERLNEYVLNQQPSIKDKLVLFAKICRAVNHAHQRGIIHRDLKPGNILVDGDGEPHVLDFGLAKATPPHMANTGPITITGEFMGTLAYASPEQAKGEQSQMDIRTDVYSLGVILYEMLTGNSPYPVDGSLSDVLRNITEVDPRKPSSICRAVDDEIETIVLSSLAKERHRRYQSAGELGRDIEYYLAGEPIEAKRESGMYVLRKHLRRHKVPVAAAISFVLLLGISSVVAWTLYMAAERARKDLVRSDYFNRIALAQTALENNDIRRVDGLLEQCPPEHRGWEFHRLSRLTDRSIQTLAGNTGVVYCTAISPDGRLIATGSSDKSIRLWNTHTGELVCTLKEHSAEVRSVAFSADGQMFASADSNGTLILWNGQSRQPIERTKGCDAGIASIAFNHDGSLLAYGCLANSLWIWNTQTNVATELLPKHANHVNSVAFSSDGRWLVSGSSDKTIRIWDVSSRRMVDPHKRLPCGVLAIAVSPDCHKVAAGCVDGLVRVWDWSGSGKISVLGGHEKRVHSVAYSPDGKWLVSSGCDNSIRVRRADSGADLAVLRGHRDIVGSVAVSQDNRWIVSASHDGTAKIWGITLSSFQDGYDSLQFKGHSNMVIDVTFSPDGSQLVSGGKDGTVRVWDRVTGEELFTLKGHRGFVESVDVSPDGTRIASASHDGSIRIWNLLTGELVWTLCGHTGPVLAVGFSLDGQRIVSGGEDTLVRVWSAKTGMELLVLAGHEAAVRSVSYCPVGSRIASAGDDGMLILRDAGKGTLLWRRSGPSDAISCAAFSPDGARIVTGNPSGPITLWDALSGEVRVLSSRARSQVLDVAFSPDSRRIASSGNDQMLRLWDVHTGEEVLCCRADEDTVRTIAFSPDGKTLASGGSDRTIKLWETADPSSDADRADTFERRQTVAAARELVDDLFRRCILAREVKQQIEADASLNVSVKAAALKLADCRGDDPLRLNREAWKIANDPGHDPAIYERALALVEAARELDPQNGANYLRTLGMAHYRTGRFQNAVTSLTSFRETVGRDDPRAIAFLAMAQFQSGNKEAAMQILNECRALLAQPQFSVHTHLKPALHEAETLICPDPPADRQDGSVENRE